MTDAPPKPMKIGFTIFPEAMSLDFIGPLDILSTLSRTDPDRPPNIPPVECILLGDTMDPVKMSNGMQVVPQLTFIEAGEQEWDAVLVPGGTGARPWFDSNKQCREFLIKVVPSCRFVFTGMRHLLITTPYVRTRADKIVVCTGSWLLAATGLLKGEKATCNKRAFKSVLVSLHQDR